MTDSLAVRGGGQGAPVPGGWPQAWRMAVIRRSRLRWPGPLSASRRPAGTPPARLAVRRGIRRSFFSELKTIMNISCSRDFSGCTPDGGDQELDVAVIKAGEGVLEIDGDAVGQACRDLQHPLLAPGAWETRAQGGDHGGPVDDGD